MFKFKAKIFVFAVLLSVFSQVIFNQAQAAQLETLYNVDVLVTGESADIRWGAFKKGLDEIFVRVSGDSIIMDKLKRPAPTKYVKQFSYDPVENPATNDRGELLSHRLKIQYNGSAMEKYLKDNGFPVWGAHRPDVVIWLAVRDGRSEYVLKSSDQSLLKMAADEALTRRGVPVKWPLYDSRDKKILKVADIRGGFKDQVQAASKRYSRGPALTGSMLWNGSQWQSSWSLLMSSGNRHWSLVDADYNRLIDKAVDQAADAMGLVFALRASASKQQLVNIQLDIQAVKSIEQFRQLEDYLNGLNAVEAARPVRVDSESVLYDLLLTTEEADFLSLLKSDSMLIKISKPVVTEAVPPAPAIVKETEINTGTGKTVQTGVPAVSEDKRAVDTIVTRAAEPSAPVYYYKLAE